MGGGVSRVVESFCGVGTPIVGLDRSFAAGETRGTEEGPEDTDGVEGARGAESLPNFQSGHGSFLRLVFCTRAVPSALYAQSWTAIPKSARS